MSGPHELRVDEAHYTGDERNQSADPQRPEKSLGHR
jgi:hypothetical protein